MTTEMTIEEREKLLDQMAQTELAKKQRTENVNAFLNEEGLTDTQKELRKKVMDEYISKKMDANPSIARNIDTIKDFYGVGLTLLESKKEIPPKKDEGTPAPGTGTTPAPIVPKVKPVISTAPEGDGKTVEEAIAESGLSKSAQDSLAAAFAMNGVDVDGL